MIAPVNELELSPFPSSPIKRFSLISLGSHHSSIPSPKKVTNSHPGLITIENHSLFKASYSFKLPSPSHSHAISLVKEKDSSSLYEEAKICRICLSSEQFSALISPCSCIGSQMYVHEDCLKIWLIKKKDEDINHCELCKDRFRMEFQVTSTCLPFNSLNTCKAWSPCLFSLVLLTIIIYICYLVLVEKTDNVMLMIGAFVLGFLCIACCVKSIFAMFSVCFERRIEDWKIENA